MKYPKNKLNEVIFHVKFSPLSKLSTIKLPRLEEVVDFVEFSTEFTGLID